MSIGGGAAGLPEQVRPPEVASTPHGWAQLVLERRTAGVVGLAVHAGAPTPSVADDAAAALGLDAAALLDHHRCTGTAGELHLHPLLASAGSSGPAASPTDDGGSGWLALVGVGDGSPTGWRRAGAALARAARDHAQLAVAAPPDDDALEALVVGVVLGSYGFSWRSRGPQWRPADRLLLVGAEGREEPVRRGRVLGAAAWRARMLATVPSSLKSPAWLAAEATAAAADSGLSAEVLDEHDLRAGGYGGLLAVGAASATPPRLVRLAYTPPGRGARRRPHVVLVGKGITFDSGGLSIKPVDGMATMKRDMTGAAVVLATLAALRDVGCPVRVTGLLALAENAVGGSSYRPGDVVRHYGGRTSEVTNTDAEGRLVLADAMAHAVADLEPDVLVDVATLTGAVKVALGQRTAGLFATDDGLAASIREAGAAAGEPWWRLPLDGRYDERIASRVADADNSASPGAVAAALFLRPFAGTVPWAHLDIASVGDSPEQWHEWSPGPTGFGVRTLLTWLRTAEPLHRLQGGDR